jgi:hypothetical protein
MASSEFKVRLSRTSSAQAVLKRERKKSTTHHKLDSVIDDDKSTDTVTGKLPVEAAYVTMKRVTEEVGQPLNAAGRSTFNKLQSLKTTPAVDLLQQKTWREFFTKKTAMHSTLAGKQAHLGDVSHDQSLPFDGRTSAEDVQNRQKEMKAQLSQTFARLVARVESLWRRLRIPVADQEFYRKTLCKGPPQSLEQCREVAHYILALKNHEQATVAVVQAIQMREMAIAKCFDVLAALQRKFSRSFHREGALSGAAANTSGRGAGNGGSWNSASRFNFAAADGISRPSSAGRASDMGTAGSSGFWKEELVCALDDVRGCTLDVIKAVQRWRRNLWRPHPFVYMGVNYVAKMKEDLGILESDIYARLLALVPLRYTDLQCVLFFDSAGRIQVDAHGPASGASTPFLNRSAAPTPSHGHHGPAPSEPSPQVEQLLHEFRCRVSARELQLAASVVLEEEVLQNALAIEQASLLHKGVFIPTLHAKRGGEERVVTRSSSLQGLHGTAARSQEEAHSTSAPQHAATPASQLPAHYSVISYGEQPHQQQPFSNGGSGRPSQQQQQQQQHHQEQHPNAAAGYDDHSGGHGQQDQEGEIDWAPDFAG